jgi:hypothetical protein
MINNIKKFQYTDILAGQFQDATSFQTAKDNIL